MNSNFIDDFRILSDADQNVIIKLADFLVNITTLQKSFLKQFVDSVISNDNKFIGLKENILDVLNQSKTPHPPPDSVMKKSAIILMCLYACKSLPDGFCDFGDSIHMNWTVEILVDITDAKIVLWQMNKIKHTLIQPADLIDHLSEVRQVHPLLKILYKKLIVHLFVNLGLQQ
jgi:hypothetical protein